jgi:hypothetical protein
MTLRNVQTWCGPCKAIAPVFDKLAQAVDWVSFVRFDVDKCPNIAAKYKVQAMPTFFAIRNGEVVETVSPSPLLLDPRPVNLSRNERRTDRSHSAISSKVQTPPG